MYRIFADSTMEYSGKEQFGIFGSPYDRTSSFKHGSARGPGAIRDCSYNFETYLFEHNVDLMDVPVWDAGDIDDHVSVDDAVENTYYMSKDILDKGLCPVLIGGEHGLAVGQVKALSEKFPGLKVIVIDAHLDYRYEYMGFKNNHACFTRRVTEIIGVENVMPIGIRSLCKEEYEDAVSSGLKFIPSFSVIEGAFSLKDIKDFVADGPVYLSIDIDGIDPAYAPGTGTPEPFGLTPMFVKSIICGLSKELVGLDLMEVTPEDFFVTACLGARLIREFIAVKSLSF